MNSSQALFHSRMIAAEILLEQRQRTLEVRQGLGAVEVESQVGLGQQGEAAGQERVTAAGDRLEHR